MKTRIVIAAGLILTLTGCAQMLNVGESSYACAGYPEGVRCMGARDVYSATENVDHIAPTDRKVEEAKKEASRETKPAVSAHLKTEPMFDTQKQIPIRTPAMVMRAWIAPWEDKNGFLHASEFIFAEIEGRKWVVGNQHVTSKHINALGGSGTTKKVSPIGE